MIIASIRLKNIKSYGEGADGKGVTISFQPGINRIAGRNGHGKSTLIESLGYALFLLEPGSEETVHLDRYFLRHGAKEGEIDVTFVCAEGVFRVERGVGKASKRRSKIIQLNDGSICAENDREVAGFLCKLLRFGCPERLMEMFSKLVGVRQGRLTWAFDSSPKNARLFFEPLLDVAIFRECYDRLKPVVDVFKDQQQGLQTRRAAVEALVKDRSDTEQRLRAAQTQARETTTNLKQAQTELAAANDAHRTLEKLEQNAIAAETRLQHSRQALEHATKLRSVSEQAVSQSTAARLKLEENQAAHGAHLAAAQALHELNQRRLHRDALLTRRTERSQAGIQSEARATAARQQLEMLGTARAEKEKLRLDAQRQADSLKADLDQTRAAFTAEQAATKRAESEIRVIADSMARLAAWLASQQTLAGRIHTLARDVAAWNPEALTRAAAAEELARSQLELARDGLAQTTARLNALQEQVKDIAGGLCPFLKEQCRQFDPARVKADAASSQAELERLKAAARTAEVTHREVKREHDRLKARHTQVSLEQSDLRDAVKQYLGELESFTSAPMRAAAHWLREWTPSIPGMPALGDAPGGPVAPEAIAGLQAQFAQDTATLTLWWQTAEERSREQLRQVRNQELDWQRREQNLANLITDAANATREIQALELRVSTLHAEAVRHDADRVTAATDLTSIDEQLKPFATLDADLAEQQRLLKVNQPGYEAWLKAKDAADQLESCQANLDRSRQIEAEAREAFNRAQTEHDSARKVFDPEALKRARENLQARVQAVAVLETILQNQARELSALETRFAEWQSACRDLAAVQNEIDRCQAAIDLAELARTSLRDSAPEVARHLCQRIAREAQRVFNQINPEPITIEWDSERYSLEIGPGDRRFSMLSGGEQTKLALAMTLAMIEQFCGLRFCVFDEPTYGVDADSRKKLADTILEAQKAAGLEQLLLVSHDDAFEGRIEHSIVLEKSAAEGTSVAL